MFTPVRKFKSLAVALKELEKVFRSGELILRGRPFENFEDGRPRELAGNWLLAAVLSHLAGTEDFTLTSERDSDGTICHLPSGIGRPTEHIIIPPARIGEIVSTEQRISDQVAKKQAKGGPAYARGKMLVIWNMLSTNAAWHPNKAARTLPPHDFDAVWVVGLQAVQDDHWIHSAALLRPDLQNIPTWIVDINPDFSGWVVRQVQFAINATVTFDLDPPDAPMRVGLLL